MGTYVQYLLFSAKRLLQSFPGFFAAVVTCPPINALLLLSGAETLFRSFLNPLRKHITKPSEQVVAPECTYCTTIKRQNDV